MTAAPPPREELLVRAFFDALNQGSLEALLAFYAPEASLTFQTPAPNQRAVKAQKAVRPRPRSLTGQDAILAYFQWLVSERRRGEAFELDRLAPFGEAFAADWHIESQDQSLLETGQELFVIQDDRILQHSTTLSELPRHLTSANVEAEDDADDEAPEGPAPEPPTPAPDPAPVPPSTWPSQCLIGLSVGAGEAELGLLRALGANAVHVGRAEAVKLPLQAPPETITALRRLKPDLFILVSVYRELQRFGEAPGTYVAAVLPQVGALYAAGARHFLIQPPADAMAFDVWRALFGSLRELADWFIAVRLQLKDQFPDAAFGFSAIRPPYDPSWATDTARFMAEVEPAVQAADWIGVPCLWASPEERESPDGGRLYRRYQAQYPATPVLITAFGNTSQPADSEAAAQEHLDYYRSLRGVPGLGAAFAEGAPGTAGLRAWIRPTGQPGLLGDVVGARRWGEPGDQPENFAGFATNDRPDGKDELNYDDYADAFVRVIRNPDTKTPLTIGIYGSWGMGKSFLMKRIRAMLEAHQQQREAERRSGPWRVRLERAVNRLRPVRGATAKPGWLANTFTRPPENDLDFHCVEFNAWVYSGSENLWAGLITHLYNEVEKYLGTRRTVPFRFSQNAQRAARKTLWLLALYGGLGLLLSLLLDWSQIQAAWAAVTTAAGTFDDAVALGGTLAALLAALAGLPPLLNALRDLATSLTLARSEQLAALASRRDFRDKIGFMADIKEEIRMVRRLLDRGRQGVRTRLVVFIDDLDRCEPRKAVEVLEAIMLLLADEDGMPFVVVLGIDARIVVKAVEERYGKVLTEAGISGYEYLDKIVQIPFRIPPPPSTALANYVTSLLWRSPADREAATKAAPPATSGQPAGTGAGRVPPPTERAGQQPDRTPPETPPTTPPPLPLDVDALKFQTRRDQPAPEVAFLPDESEAFEAYAKGDHLSPNPRRIKRILNIYRVVRLLKPNTTAAERQRMIKWVVLTEQWPFRTAWLLQAAEDDYQRPAAERRLPPAGSLRQIYALVAADVYAKDAQPFASLDADPDLFESFIDAAPALTVADLHRLRPFTFNLNPALQGEVTKAVLRKSKEVALERKNE